MAGWYRNARRELGPGDFHEQGRCRNRLTLGASALVAGANVSLRRLGFWLGPDWTEAQAAYERARALGMSKARAEAIGHVASREDCWAFARTIALRVGVHVRTVQRAFAEAKALGMLRTARAKKGEVPKGASAAFACGWSHRWIIGRGLAGHAWKAAIDKARLRWLGSLVKRSSVPASERELAARAPEVRRPPRGMSTREWLERELAELAEHAARAGPS